MSTKQLSEAGGQAGTSPNPRRRILVVDDDSAVRRVNSEVLIYSGYRVNAAEDGKAAWDALQLIDYDLMITDNDIPKVTGVELIQKLHAAGRMMPVIMVTGAPPDEELIRHQLMPPAMTLIKPYTFEELLTAVKTVLRSCQRLAGRNGAAAQLASSVAVRSSLVVIFASPVVFAETDSPGKIMS